MEIPKNPLNSLFLLLKRGIFQLHYIFVFKGWLLWSPLTPFFKRYLYQFIYSLKELLKKVAKGSQYYNIPYIYPTKTKVAKTIYNTT
jgi:hypothetical protein